MSQQFDVLVIGGGIVGLTAALAMAQRHYSVAVLDAGKLTANLSKQDLRVYAINQASQNLLEELDVWQYLDAQRVSPYSKMHVWDAANGAAIDFDSRYIAAQYLGSIIEENVLKQALLQQISTQTNIHLFPDSIVDEVHCDAEAVRVHSTNKLWQGHFLMIADGANSPTRQKLNVELTTWSYHQQAVVATVQTEKPHLQTAYQVFNADGPLALLPLVDQNQCSIVWSTNPERAQHLIDLSDDAFNEELTKAFAGKLGQVQVLSSRHQFPLQMRHVKQYSAKGWLLLGDAAHTIHPLAGLGLNLGLADVRSWMNCMDTTKGAIVTTKQLGAYQRERKHAVWQTIMMMEGFKRLFSNTFLPITGLRGLGLNLCNELTPLKRLFIEHAAG